MKIRESLFYSRLLGIHANIHLNNEERFYDCWMTVMALRLSVTVYLPLFYSPVALALWLPHSPASHIHTTPEHNGNAFIDGKC